jgi:hypothetical protein
VIRARWLAVAAGEQLSHFLRPDGKLETNCSAVCDPE